jgi:hypothetical protein
MPWNVRPLNLTNCVERENFELNSKICFLAEKKLRSEFSYFESFLLYDYNDDEDDFHNEDFGKPLCANYNDDFYSYWCDFKYDYNSSKSYYDYRYGATDINEYEFCSFNDGYCHKEEYPLVTWQDYWFAENYLDGKSDYKDRMSEEQEIKLEPIVELYSMCSKQNTRIEYENSDTREWYVNELMYLNLLAFGFCEDDK